MKYTCVRETVSLTLHWGIGTSGNGNITPWDDPAVQRRENRIELVCERGLLTQLLAALGWPFSPKSALLSYFFFPALATPEIEVLVLRLKGCQSATWRVISLPSRGTVLETHGCRGHSPILISLFRKRVKARPGKHVSTNLNSRLSILFSFSQKKPLCRPSLCWTC